MKPSIKDWRVWMPLVIALSFGGGLLSGVWLGRKSPTSGPYDKINEVLGLIREQYVDDIDIDSLVEVALPDLLSHLDPHSVYIPAADLRAANEELEGSFSGVGISFSLQNDTLMVVEIISGGPAEAAGILAGDRIVQINDSSSVGPEWNVERVRNTLRGPEGTTVKVGVKRSTAPEILDFEITRGQIPITSVDAAYRLPDGTAYIKLNRFGEHTYDEFIQATAEVELKSDNDRLILDLRGNGGGYMAPAVLIANEFLGRGKEIVSTIGRHSMGASNDMADGSGSFLKTDVVVLIDEFSASASEILAGALQDNDRALIVGRRSFGKGLVQNQILLSDSSAIRLTIARYYTPAGRCIQKSYADGESEYSNDIIRRYERGEFTSADSIKFDTSKMFPTSTGRTVYGGGGIMPDIFVASDTVGVTSYYMSVLNAGLLQKFSFNYCDRYRRALNEAQSVADLDRILPDDDTLLEEFVEYATDEGGIPARWYYINISRDLLVNSLKAWIARDALGAAAFYEVYNRGDATLSRAVEALHSGRARAPIMPEFQPKPAR